jgi:SAM-dependent methyltransferase
MRTKISCDICRKDAQFWATIVSYDHYRCAKCGHLFVYPKPSQQELDNFYLNGRYYDKAEGEKARLVKEASLRMEKLQRLATRFNLSRRLLDVGCASGYFIRQAATAGWYATGVDRSEDIARRARESSGAEVFSGRIEQMELGKGAFSIVTAWEVVEHTTDPRAFFSALARNVAAGGLLALSTPLANGVPAKLMGTRFPMLTPPEHLSLFTRQSIKLLASEFGFKEVSYRSFSNLGPRSLASGLSKLLIGKNIGQAPVFFRSLWNLTGVALAWIPMIVDSIGLGTEMEIIFRYSPDENMGNLCE